MDVAISELRAHLRSWVEEARAGGEVVLTDRGIPVARLVGVDSSTVIERLERDGLLTRSSAASRPKAAGRRRVRSTGSVSDLVTDLRR